MGAIKDIVTLRPYLIRTFMKKQQKTSSEINLLGM